ncbi:MAG: hypothetical protein ACI89L_001505 [Phycisphaerales bacterium]|jgi:hypothetical protein
MRLPRRIIPLALLALLVPGCTRLGLISSANGSLVGADSAAVLSPDFRVLVFARSENDSTADLYFTDLSDEQIESYFDDSAAWTQISGSIVHVHMFIKPYAGRTPIQSTAANASMRWAVLADGEIGVYTGAGFVFPGRTLLGSKISGSVRGATLRLTRATEGFHDPLGPSSLSMSFSAKKDADMAEGLSRRLDAAARRATKVAETLEN